MQNLETEFDQNTLQRQLGEVNLVFQYLENELLEIEWFCTDAKSLKPRRHFVDIVKDVRRTVNSFLDRTHVPQDAPLRTRFAKALTDALQAAKQRNRAVHSVYRWHETFQGSPPVTRTFTDRNENGTMEHKVESVTEQTIPATSELVKKSFEELFALHHSLMYALPQPAYK